MLKRKLQLIKQGGNGKSVASIFSLISTMPIELLILFVLKYCSYLLKMLKRVPVSE